MAINPKNAVKQIVDRYNQEINGLYHDGSKRQAPAFAQGTIDFHMKGINARVVRDLFQIREMAASQKSAADKLEAQSQRSPETYLSDRELKTYQLRGKTIAQDLQEHDTDFFIQNAQAAIETRNKPAAVAYLKNLPEPETVPEQRQVNAMREKLEKTVIPAEYQNAEKRAHDMRLGATIADVEAHSAIHDLTGEPAANFNPFS